MDKPYGKEAADSNRVALQATQSEHHTQQALAFDSEATQIASLCHVIVTTYRCNRYDADNVSTKGTLDGLVRAGILEDDNCTIIKAITKIANQVRHKSEERTVIEIYEW